MPSSAPQPWRGAGSRVLSQLGGAETWERANGGHRVPGAEAVQVRPDRARELRGEGGWRAGLPDEPGHRSQRR